MRCGLRSGQYVIKTLHEEGRVISGDVPRRGFCDSKTRGIRQSK